MTQEASRPATCPRCQAPLPDTWRWRLCPACLLRTAVAPEVGDAADSEPSEIPEAAKEETIPPERRGFGRFELLAELGRGGQGLVFRARDPSLGRVVALKVLRGAARAGPEARARFEAEARAMAAVRHPNLVSIYEVGEVGGEPYYTMDYVAGRDLGKILAEGPVPPRQAAEWVRSLAGAVQVAHEHGVLHLDLKPSNVLVDEAGVPHIADFGLAKWIEGAAAFTLTLSHQVLGSPHYMAPEQAAGRRRAAGPTTDVYGLGAILYHLLTGRPPFEGESPTAVLRLVLEEEVIPPRRLQPGVPADLETICLKALRKEPRERYASARELGDDLARWLAGEPIRARPVTPLERAWRWCRRRPGLATALTVSAVLLLTLAIGGPLAAISIQRSRQAAERAEAERRGQLREALLAKAHALRLSGRPGQRDAALAAISEAVRLRPGPDARREAVAALALPELRHWRTLNLGNQPVAFDAALRRYATNDAAGNFHIRDLADDRPLFWLPAGDRGVPHQFGFSPDGEEFGASYTTHELRVWRLASQPPYTEARAHAAAGIVAPPAAQPRLLRLPWGAREGRVVPGTRWFAVDAADGAVRFYDRDTLAEVHRLDGQGWLAFIQFSPDGRRFARHEGGRVTMTDLRTGQAERSWDTGLPIQGVTWHPDGVQLVAWSLGRLVQIWNADTGAEIGLLSGHQSAVVGAAFDARGRWLVTQSWDNETVVWDVARQQPVLRLPLAGNRLRLSPDGRRLLFQSWADDVWHAFEMVEDGILQMLEPPASAATPEGNRDLWTMAFTDTGLLAGTGSDCLMVWSPGGPSFGQCRQETILHQLSAVPGGGVLTARDAEFRLQSWRTNAHGRLEFNAPQPFGPPAPGPVRDFSLSADGRRLAVITQDGGAVWQGAPAAGGAWQPVAEAGFERVDLDRAGRRLAASARAGGATLWEVEPLRRRHVWPGPRWEVLQLSPDGRWLIAGDRQRLVLYDADTGRAVRELPRHSVNYPQAAWSPDGALLLVHENDGAVRLLAAGTWEELAELPAPPMVRGPAFSADGRWLAVPGEKAGAALWDLARLRERLAEMGLDW